MPKPPSLSDVARIAGVSKATASRALRGSSVVLPATRAKVERAAQDLDYQANSIWGSILKEVRSGGYPERQGTLALLNYRPNPPEWHGVSYYRRILAGIRDRAEQLRFGLDEIFLDDKGLTAGRLGGVLAARGIRGLLIPPLSRGAIEMDIDWGRFAAVAVGFHINEPRLNRVAPDNHYNLKLAWSKLVEIGYERIGLALYGPVDTASNFAWREAYRTMQENGSHRLTALRPYRDSDFDQGSLEGWIRAECPDAVIVSQKRVREGIASYCERSRTPYPRFIDLNAHAEDEFESEGVDQNLEAVGEAALDTLVMQLHLNQLGEPKAPRSILIEGRWRGSSQAE